MNSEKTPATSCGASSPSSSASESPSDRVASQADARGLDPHMEAVEASLSDSLEEATSFLEIEVSKMIRSWDRDFDPPSALAARVVALMLTEVSAICSQHWTP